MAAAEGGGAPKGPPLPFFTTAKEMEKKEVIPVTTMEEMMGTYHRLPSEEMSLKPRGAPVFPPPLESPSSTN